MLAIDEQKDLVSGEVLHELVQVEDSVHKKVSLMEDEILQQDDVLSYISPDNPKKTRTFYIRFCLD
tara:strand:- start:340 stop:537 length:198 start_codon:yes stop_codon:yes gene_type:complete